MIKRLFTVAAMLFALNLTALADTYDIDGSHSSVEFSVRHMAISKVTGSFNEYSGTIKYDPADTSQWAVNVTIQTASVDTRNEDRDKHLRNDDFFNSAEYPTMTFKSTEVIPGKDGSFQLVGDLTMRNVTKPVTLDVEFLGAIDDPWGNKRAGFSASATIDRLDYGVKYSTVMETGGLMVSHDVAISVEIEAVSKKPEAEEAGE